MNDLYAYPNVLPWKAVSVGDTPLEAPQLSSGLLLVYPTRAAYEAAHPDTAPLVLRVELKQLASEAEDA